MKFSTIKIIGLVLMITMGIIFVTNNCYANTEYSSYNEDVENPALFKTVRASHILVDTEDQAWAIKTRITEGEDFGALAEKYSKCPSKEKGGDLGFFNRGQMVPEFENAAFSTPIGGISDPVKTRFGWHLIKVTRKMRI